MLLSFLRKPLLKSSHRPVNHSMTKKIVIVALLGCAFTAVGRKAKAAPFSATCAAPYVFFDVGRTLVDTETNNYNPMTLQIEADEYLKAVKAHGNPMGLVSDVPEAWGRDLPEVSSVRDYPTAKLLRFIEFMHGTFPGDHASWKGPEFDTTYFGEFVGQGADMEFHGRVFLPATTAERKKSGSSVLFQRAVKMAADNGCPALYFSDDETEMNPARVAGMVPYLVGSQKGGHRYLAADEFDDYIRTSQQNP